MGRAEWRHGEEVQLEASPPNESEPRSPHSISCIICRRRKVRCNKREPCSNCYRAGIQCIYRDRITRKLRAASDRGSPERKSALVARLGELEAKVRELRGQTQVKSHGNETPNVDACKSTPLCHDKGWQEIKLPVEHESASRTEECQSGIGRLIRDDNDNSPRYVSWGFWATIPDEQTDSVGKPNGNVMDDESNELECDADSDYCSEFDLYPEPSLEPTLDPWILAYTAVDIDLREYYPPPSQISFLWTIYRENIEPFVKLLHVPSMEAVLRNARREPEKLSTAQEALILAIYYAAITSLEPDEVNKTFGACKADLLARYRSAVELAFAKARIMQSCDLTIIQALALFLHVFRCQGETMLCWSLTGLAIHLAQGIGLQRDGSRLGLRPFETEVRRRVWWQLVLLDLRAANEGGGDIIIRDGSYDTEMPTNINDADISPETREIPEARQGLTDCSIALVLYETGRVNSRIIRASLATSARDAPILRCVDLLEREQVLVQLSQLIHTNYIRHFIAHEADPLYRMATMMTRLILAKTCLLIYQPVLFDPSIEQLTDDAKQRVYMAAIEIMEYSHMLRTDAGTKQYMWLLQTYPNWHVMTYFLLASSRRPWTCLVERGWQALQKYWRLVKLTEGSAQTAVAVPFRQLYSRTAAHRAAQMNRPMTSPGDDLQESLREELATNHEGPDISTMEAAPNSEVEPPDGPSKSSPALSAFSQAEDLRSVLLFQSLGKLDYSYI